MKKIYAFRKHFFITAFSLTFFNSMYAQLPFADGFESGNFVTGGWTVSGGAQISTLFPATGVYCAEGPATWGLVKIIPSISVSLLEVEFAAKASQTNTTCMIFRIKDTTPSGTSAGMFMDNVGNIMVVNGTMSLPIAVYTPGTWYLFRFVLDMNTHTYDVFIDNILKADDFAFFSPGFLQPYLFTWSSVATSGSAWLDDVNIYAPITGMNETHVRGNSFSVNPNPSTGKFVAEASGSIMVYNNAGEKLFEQKNISGKTEIDLSRMPAGVYFITVRDEKNNLLVRKIVKM